MDWANDEPQTIELTIQMDYAVLNYWFITTYETLISLQNLPHEVVGEICLLVLDKSLSETGEFVYMAMDYEVRWYL